MTAMLRPDILEIGTPRWALPLLKAARYKGAKGGRSSGKSHFFAESLVERLVYSPDEQWVCIREIQKSLKFSAKKTIENKIKKLGVGGLFEVTLTEIRRRGHDGIIIFQGMQDHTAESIKSLEGFDGAWIEEAQSLSARSLELLIPTIRKPGSELWFSWNSDQPDDAVEVLFRENPKAVLVHVNYIDNPWCPDEMIELAGWQRQTDYDRFVHIWLGGYNLKSEAQVFGGKYRAEEFEVPSKRKGWDGPYYGLDWGFSQDPTAGLRTWVNGDKLMIDYEYAKVGLELDETAQSLIKAIPDIEKHTVRADNARPESISYVRRKGLPLIEGAKKGKGSVEDGIQFIKSFKEIVIHPRCKKTLEEFRLYRYKVDRLSGNVLPDLVDEHNHLIDSLRYALEPIMRRNKYSWSGFT